ncbi:MAG: DUF2400 family protein [Deltaproteobacteria bacterium]|nr:DUF2400 family protein [Deltaproteobacteria bacterium]
MDGIREHLDALLASCDAESTRSRDPVDFVHSYDEPRDQEIVGLLAASLAFGNAVAARRSIDRVLTLLGPEPAAAVVGASQDELRRRLQGFVHRIYRGEHIASVLWRAGRLFREHETLGNAFVHFHRASDGDFREALARFATLASRESVPVAPTQPSASSAFCKTYAAFGQPSAKKASELRL